MDLIEQGIKHITDLNGFDHLLFLFALIAPYSFKDWRKWMTLVTFFAIGHSITLLLSTLDILSFDSNWIEFFIPVTILLTALYNSFFRKITKGHGLKIEILFTLIFGFIHGSGFSGYLRMILREKHFYSDLFNFNIGIEIGQLMIVVSILILGWLICRIPKVTKGYWTNSLNILAIVLSCQMIWKNWVF